MVLQQISNINNNLNKKKCGIGTSYSDEICDELDNGDHEDEQNHVQEQANYLTMAETYLMYVPAVLYLILAMAWSDRHGLY